MKVNLFRKAGAIGAATHWTPTDQTLPTEGYELLGRGEARTQASGCAVRDGQVVGIDGEGIPVAPYIIGNRIS